MTWVLFFSRSNYIMHFWLLTHHLVEGGHHHLFLVPKRFLWEKFGHCRESLMALLFFSETKLVKETQTLGNKTPFADKHSSKLLDICDDISSSSSSSTRWSVISIYRYSGSLLNVTSITEINPKEKHHNLCCFKLSHRIINEKLY